MVLILDGKMARDEIAKTLRKKIAAFSSKPTLAIIQIGGKPESSAYIGQKKLFGDGIGAEVRHIQKPESASEKDISSCIKELNADASVHGIILQLPIPPHLDKKKLLDAISLGKDVDGLAAGSIVTPATARSILELLEFYRIPIRGKRAAILGRSTLVGTPTAEALRNAGAVATVCHSETPNTKDITHASDIVVVAIGKPKLIGVDYFRNDRTQVVVDVGITAVTEKGAERLEEEIPKRRLVGDVDFEAVKEMVFAISPVPGGVGPMTVASLFQNLVEAYERQVKPQ